jgi:hypothetical protein
MRAIRNATNHELEWVQPRLLSDTYELHMLGGELLARMAMRGSNSADAVCSDGSYTFPAEGPLQDAHRRLCGLFASAHGDA